ncbi:TQO small subunit DoxD [Pseudarthrobacter albicanus]|uniref:TQO small subunit DoxD n=1 Tax=Pseudarthrobacter albicanus TaxID=2823873 RepID=UPI001BA593B2|nr:TQO small subunit DoxD [Pseudarthrobacter albicanus]
MSDLAEPTTTGGTAADEGLDAGRAARAVIAGLRIAVALLWIQNVSWKIPPDFGRNDHTGLFQFTSYAVEHPVVPPFSWLVQYVVLPNFTLFGYATLLVEFSLGAFLLAGLLTRFWAALGILQTLAITMSVLNAPNEWHWSYYLMLAVHAVLIATAAGRAAGLDGLLRPRWRTSSNRLATWALRAS